MTDAKLKKIRSYIAIYLTVLTIIVGVLFVVQTCDIYFKGKELGEQIYTVSTIKSHFMKICIPTYLLIASIIGDIIFRFFFPYSDKSKINVSNSFFLKSLQEKLKGYDLTNANKDDLNAIKRERKNRLIFIIVNSVISLGCIIMSSLFLFNFDNFTQNGNLLEEAINLAAHLLPWAVISGGLWLTYLTYADRSYLKEIKLIRNIIKGQKSNSLTSSEVKEKYIILGVRVAVLCVAIVFIVLGVINEGYHDVLTKAINICTECIGLG